MSISQRSLNARQRDVLLWVSNGCPNDVWPDHTYKIVATALVSRRLITVSKRGGTWTATLLPAGKTYIETGDYPHGHWPTGKERVQAPSTLVRPPRQPPGPITEMNNSLPAKKPAGLTPTLQLVADIVAAGGVLERNTKNDKRKYGALVAQVNRRQLAPDGQRIIALNGERHEDLVLKLVSVSSWKSAPPQHILDARSLRLHPAVAFIRDNDRLTHIGRDHRRRALRLLQCVAVEAQARGATVRHVAPPAGNDYYSLKSAPRGLIVLSSDGFNCPINLKQLQDRVPHTPTQREMDDAKRYSWNRVPAYDHVPCARLSMVTLNASGYPSEKSWPDTPTVSIEERLPDIVSSFEMWAIADTENKRRLADQKEARERTRKHENEQARVAYIRDATGRQLMDDAESWERVNRLTLYLASLRAKAELIEEPEDRSSATEWLDWCEEYLETVNPLSRPIRRPVVKEPDSTQISDFRRRLGFSSSWW